MALWYILRLFFTFSPVLVYILCQEKSGNPVPAIAHAPVETLTKSLFCSVQFVTRNFYVEFKMPPHERNTSTKTKKTRQNPAQNGIEKSVDWFRNFQKDFQSKKNHFF
jgi:sulfur relay (sulfurtransferase) DsrC/TusE family protein